jgi:hypothetical protein
VIHDTLLVADHGQALCVATLTLPVPPRNGTLSFDGEIE